jgi:hypothetical protein
VIKAIKQKKQASANPIVAKLKAKETKANPIIANPKAQLLPYK